MTRGSFQGVLEPRPRQDGSVNLEVPGEVSSLVPRVPVGRRRCPRPSPFP